MQRLKTEKFLVRLCVMSYRLLESFLSENSLLAILEILNERVKIVIEDRPPHQKREVICLGEGRRCPSTPFTVDAAALADEIMSASWPLMMGR